MPTLHRTYGVYPDGSWKRNAVDPAHLEHHVEYNKGWRPGRALIVDGAVLHPGGVQEEVLRTFLEHLPELDAGWDPRLPSTPYQ